MHIYSNIKNFLYDNENFIAYFNNKIYLYNIIKIDSLTTNSIIVYFKDKKVEIIGKSLKPRKCLNKELLISGFIERIIFYEK